VATLASLIDRVRLELGDMGKSFVVQFMADGSSNRFTLQYSPVDGTGLTVYKDGVDISEESSVEESTGTLVLDTLPDDGEALLVSGTYYRYFTTAELGYFVDAALQQHTARKTDEVGRKITLENLAPIEEYPVALYASTLALYTLATDASFDINIFAPDGVTIPRSERYRQLMEIIDSRREQYRELCTQLGIGLYTIEVFTLRRISKTSNRYVPVYKPQEVDDRSWGQRADLVIPNYGSRLTPWPTDGGELTAYEGIAYTTDIPFTGDFTGKSFIARLIVQRGSLQVVRTFELEVATTDDVNYVATVSLTAENTRRLAKRTYWQLASINDSTQEIIEILGGSFFTERASEVRV
jgi:hypothetical protein